MLSACSTIVSGIKCDTTTQNHLTEHQLLHFSSVDQIVTNTAIPLGMILFGISSHFSISNYSMVLLEFTVMSSYWFIRTGEHQIQKELAHD